MAFAMRLSLRFPFSTAQPYGDIARMNSSIPRSPAQ